MVCKQLCVLLTVHFILFNTLTNIHTYPKLLFIVHKYISSKITYSKIVHYLKIRRYHRLMEDALVFGLKILVLDGK